MNIDKISIIKKITNNLKNTGSSEVQIAILNEEINILNNHFSIHKKDFHSYHGLLKKIGKRKKMLNYLKKSNFENYLKIIKILKLRG